MIRLAVLLIGDLAKLCGQRLIDGLTQPFVKNLIDKCTQYTDDMKMMEAGKFASESVFNVTGQKIWSK